MKKIWYTIVVILAFVVTISEWAETGYRVWAAYNSVVDWVNNHGLYLPKLNIRLVPKSKFDSDLDKARECVEWLNVNEADINKNISQWNNEVSQAEKYADLLADFWDSVDSFPAEFNGVKYYSPDDIKNELKSVLVQIKDKKSEIELAEEIRAQIVAKRNALSAKISEFELIGIERENSKIVIPEGLNYESLSEVNNSDVEDSIRQASARQAEAERINEQEGEQILSKYIGRYRIRIRIKPAQADSEDNKNDDVNSEER